MTERVKTIYSNRYIRKQVNFLREETFYTGLRDFIDISPTCKSL